MLRLAADADVHGGIVRGLRRRLPGLDLITALDALPEGTPDPAVLAWAAAEGRILISNDRRSMIGFAIQRAVSGQPMPGLISTTNEQTVGSTLDDISLIVQSLTAEEVAIQVVIFLPF
jgi:hypothetical protein